MSTHWLLTEIFWNRYVEKNSALDERSILKLMNERYKRLRKNQQKSGSTEYRKTNKELGNIVNRALKRIEAEFWKKPLRSRERLKRFVEDYTTTDQT